MFFGALFCFVCFAKQLSSVETGSQETDNEAIPKQLSLVLGRHRANIERDDELDELVSDLLILFYLISGHVLYRLGTIC